ncbi:glycosyltransferase, partial [Burkholderia contaminans]|nr:glycosyltransferase [Burkholderia contaminans]
VSGVATSIRTLKTELEKQGHAVFIFTTTDKDVNRYEDWQIIRIPSVPFFAFKDRRFAYRGFSKALEIALKVKIWEVQPTGEVFLERLETGQLVPILLQVWLKNRIKRPNFGRGVANRISCTK